MNIFQKLKIKLFGKERWRVVTFAETGDVVVYRGGKTLIVIDWRSGWYIKNISRHLKAPYTIYRKTN